MIRLAKLRREFDDLVAVNDIEVEIPEGEIYGLIGPNGAGKTTTIRMACGLLSPTAGQAFIAGVDVHQEPERAHQFIGYLSDFFSVYEDLMVWEYLDYFAHAYKMPEAQIRPRIEEVIAQVGLEVKRNVLIKGLSRGMKQRLGIARAVLHHPQVLLLDEPASGLDPKARFELRNLLKALREQGATVLISSHILTELEGFCTSIGVMEKGRMLRSGRLEDIVAAEAQVRVVRMGWLGEASAEATLKAAPLVSSVMVSGSEAVFRFAGSEEELSMLLAALVDAGIRVLAFAEVKQTVEDVYLKLSRHEVM